MPRSCKLCEDTEDYYAKGLCSACYHRVLREQRRENRIQSHKGVTTLPGEMWKDVVGYEGVYMVSSTGRVKSVTRSVNRTDGKQMTYYEKELRLRSDKDGYLSVALFRQSKIKSFRVHRLVAEAFIGTPPEGKTLINHKNGIKCDNRVENLEWCNAFDNQQHRVYVLGKTPRFGMKAVRCVETGEVFPSIHMAARWARAPEPNLCVALHKKDSSVLVKGYHWEFARLVHDWGILCVGRAI